MGLRDFWGHVFEVLWTDVACDFQQVYGIDLDDVADRSWHWIHARIMGLLSTESRLSAWVAAQSKEA
ncbi:hypothetical protein [Mycetocola saprophilus]|uniref:hypothetical protein n=1 Tax=Mycetocola saprophilus TaxID=76636 RepID=UPI0004C25101|nr:hypothetical protein [Mycetocola saprophilus]